MGGKERKVERAEGLATVLAIGTANPPTEFDQSQYPDFYFNVTNSNHMTNLKDKFKHICDTSGIRKRHLYLTEDIIKSNPSICGYAENSFDVRQDMLVVEIPKLAREASLKAIMEWGQLKSKITHLIFCSIGGIDMPGADWKLTKLLGLCPSVKRLMMYQQGCFAGGTALRIAKDLAENNKGARVLIACSEMTVVTFRGPNEAHLDNLLMQAIFGDGASAIIVGSDPIPQVETPWFEIHWTGSTILPESDDAIEGHLREVGLILHIHKDVPKIISNNIEFVLKDVFEKVLLDGEGAPLSYNDVFWIAHPGGPSILDHVEAKLKLMPEKLHASRAILSEYGNMSSACVHFIMDYLRKKSMEKKSPTTGDGCDWGLLLGLGSGLTVETVVLKSVPLSI